MNIEKKDLLRRLRCDIVVVAVILAIALLTFLIPYYINEKRAGSKVIILQNGEETGSYNLSENNTVIVCGEDGGYNLILISNSEVRVTDADCPDKLCIRQREISRNGESIICLPHKLVVMIESPEESDLDAVTN